MCAGSFAVAAEAPVAETKLGTVVVQGAKKTEAKKAEERLEEVPGSVSVVDNAEVEKGRAATLEDVLAFQPGVIAQSAGGNDAIKISIRGSGANASPGYFREGVKFLFDGLALTGPGGTPYELLETSGVSYTEVLRGANAFDYTALSLGGAINMITHTGYTSPGNYARFEAGSFGWRKQQLSTGGVEGNADYYVSLHNSERDGYQDYTFTKAKGVVSNFGYRFSPKLDTRLIIRYREQYHENSGTLTRAQLESDSSQPNLTTVAQRGDSTKNGSIWVGSKTTYSFDDDSKIELGLVYHNYRQILGEKSPVIPNHWQWRDLNTSLRYLRTDEIFGRQSNTTIAFSNTLHDRAEVSTYNGITRQLVKDTNYSGSFDTVFSVGNDLELTDRLWLSSGLSLVNIVRDVDVKFSDRANTTPFPDDYKYDNWSLAPRIGLRYYLTPDVQLFTNVSRSIDPPSAWSISPSGPTNNYTMPLVEQKANTFEVGIRGSQGIVSGSLALYRSWIHNELLNVEVVPASGLTPALTRTSNATPTIHQGVEAGLDIDLWQGVRGDNLLLRQSYTLNDFYYRNDDEFDANELPGLPRHIYQAELKYQHPTGFYAGIDVRSASSTAVDYANSFYAPSYVVWGAKFGYEEPGQRWQVFLDLRNLTDEDYATAISPIYNARGNDAAALYVGDGFGAFTGVSFRF
ncbi:MAG: TonB-dependent receptor family protein [Pseudomonas sp.]|uniref:TonB-dependent receptor family protein n=1 Tax=Pseudomonas sp. TaxID=306 RepID=UPI003D0BB150